MYALGEVKAVLRKFSDCVVFGEGERTIGASKGAFPLGSTYSFVVREFVEPEKRVEILNRVNWQLNGYLYKKPEDPKSRKLDLKVNEVVVSQRRSRQPEHTSDTYKLTQKKLVRLCDQILSGWNLPTVVELLGSQGLSIEVETKLGVVRFELIIAYAVNGFLEESVQILSGSGECIAHFSLRSLFLEIIKNQTACDEDLSREVEKLLSWQKVLLDFFEK